MCHCMEAVPRLVALLMGIMASHLNAIMTCLLVVTHSVLVMYASMNGFKVSCVGGGCSREHIL
jgi:hypothetical protein